jgi:hypothetical protein
MDQGKPLNLEILYMDSESNRRWALRFNDPKQLEQIDAVNNRNFDSRTAPTCVGSG